MTGQKPPGGHELRRVIAHVDLLDEQNKRAQFKPFVSAGGSAQSNWRGLWIEHSILDPDKYEMIVTLTAEVDDGRRVTSAGFGLGGPRRGIAAIWFRYRGPHLSDDPGENDRLLDETDHVGAPDIEDAVNQALGRDPAQHRPPKLPWAHLIDALAQAGIKTTEEELIALPLNIEHSDLVKAQIKDA